MSEKIIQLSVFILFALLPVIFSRIGNNFPDRFLIYYYVILIVITGELYNFQENRYINQKYPDISEKIIVKIIAGKFTDGIFNDVLQRRFLYPRITNEATIAFGNTTISDGTRIPDKYPLPIQLIDFIFLKFMNHCYHSGWNKLPVESDSTMTFLRPSSNDSGSPFKYEDIPLYIRENNIFFNNEKIFNNGGYINNKTIRIFLWPSSEPIPFQIILPPEVKMDYEIDKDGWPTNKICFHNMMFNFSIKILNLTEHIGYPLGFHLKNDHMDSETGDRLRSIEMIVSFEAKFKKSWLKEKALSGYYNWTNTFLNRFKFYFDYNQFKSELLKFKSDTKDSEKPTQIIVLPGKTP